MIELSVQSSSHITVRALLLGDQIDTSGLERHDVLSTTPWRFVSKGAHLLRFSIRGSGLIRHDPVSEDEIIRSLDGRIVGRFPKPEEETADIEIALIKTNKSRPMGRSRLRRSCLSTS